MKQRKKERKVKGSTWGGAGRGEGGMRIQHHNWVARG